MSWVSLSLMVDPRPTSSKHQAISARLNPVLALIFGLAGGVLLWGVITLLTQNAILGVVFGLIPGVVIGVGLALTTRR